MKETHKKRKKKRNEETFLVTNLKNLKNRQRVFFLSTTFISTATVLVFLISFSSPLNKNKINKDNKDNKNKVKNNKNEKRNNDTFVCVVGSTAE